MMPQTHINNYLKIKMTKIDYFSQYKTILINNSTQEFKIQRKLIVGHQFMIFNHKNLVEIIMMIRSNLWANMLRNMHKKHKNQDQEAEKEWKGLQLQKPKKCMKDNKTMKF